MVDKIEMGQIFVHLCIWETLKHFSVDSETIRSSCFYLLNQPSLERDNLLLVLLSSGQCHLTLLLEFMTETTCSVAMQGILKYVFSGFLLLT